MEAMRLSLGNWSTLSELAYAVRYDVFVLEQGVPVEIEEDEFDEHAVHALVQLSEKPVPAIATGRLVIQSGEYFSGTVGRVGRLAVREAYRRGGVGQWVLSALIQAGQARGLTHFELHAQVAARGLYERLGFVAQGEVFDEAGIDHVFMVQHVSAKPRSV